MLPAASVRSGVQIARTSTILMTADVDPMIIARGTPGFSGADLQNMVKYVWPHLISSPIVWSFRFLHFLFTAKPLYKHLESVVKRSL